MHLSLVIPCYNEEETINLMYNELIKVFEGNQGLEILFVNDGSKDNTLSEITKLAQTDERIKFISFSRNFGKEAAMFAGMKYASGEYIGILDSDLQHPPSMLPEMIKALDEGYDVAAARRTNRSGEAAIKSFFSHRFYSVINKLADVKIEEGAQDFRVMKRKVVDSILNMTEYFRFSKGIFSWVGFKTKWFAHGNIDRPAGKSKFNTFKLFRYAMDGIISFSVVPLRISLIFGIVVSIIGYGYGISIIISTLITKSAGTGYGYASLMSGLLIIGGTILICLGILGEYISRIYIETKSRPLFIVDKTNII
ncbi:MAG: glycosyltransferase family 2 protein [Treponema sp.]|nr:glycosyltransferase family 2 protein [Treponema sp.]MCL2271286.1 glycosyltransferase family 2 protein [Treponema sp.]